MHWDPIGVADVPEAGDEYEPYVPALAGLVASGAGIDALAARLVEIECREMGWAGNGVRARDVAMRLCALPWDRDWQGTEHTPR